MTTDSIQDLVKRLRAIDHTSVEDCFLQSPYFHKAADALEAMAAEVAGLKEAHAAELKLCDEELFRVNKQWSDMCKRAEAAEAKRDRTRADYEAMKAHNKELFGKLSAAELERDRLKAALQDCVDAYDFVIVDECDRGWSSVSDAIHAARKALGGDA